MFKKSQQKTRLSASFLTENNVDALCPDLSVSMLSQNTNYVKCVPAALSKINVDLTEIEPANPDYLGPGVYQHQAHTKLVYQITKKIATAWPCSPRNDVCVTQQTASTRTQGQALSAWNHVACTTG